jgi:hypothetical protein
MDLPSLIRKQLGEVDFVSLVPDFLFSDQKEYHLSFYQITVDEDRVPKAEFEHMDKKLSRLEVLVRSMKKDIKDLEKFMADNKNHGELEDGLQFAKGIYGRFHLAQKRYPHQIGIQVADWRLLARSRALQPKVIATYLVKADRSIAKISTAARPTNPLGYGVAHIAINVSPKDCDLFYYQSFQPMPRMGLGMAHRVNFSKGVLKEVESYQTYIS